ncbi:MAG: hypothetical protein IJX69_06710 [Oscillospiraceae bacterium]|nr:hypothetical protein [Oscillospiraceae bacterium]
MAEFKIKIAGRVGAVSSLFESTRDYCRAYLTDEAPDFSVTVTRADLVFEQSELDEEARQEGFRLRVFTDPFLERAAILRKFAEHLLGRGTLLFHGSGIAVDGEGFLFTAKSGTGKSTHTRLWRQVFGERAVMVNDDKPFLGISGEGVTMYGAPWSGKHGLDANVAVPLRGICILERGTENRIHPISPAEALPRLLHESFCPEGHEARLHALVDALVEGTPLWRMECNKDPQAAMVAWEAMSGQNEQK